MRSSASARHISATPSWLDSAIFVDQPLDAAAAAAWRAARSTSSPGQRLRPRRAWRRAAAARRRAAAGTHSGSGRPIGGGDGGAQHRLRLHRLGEVEERGGRGLVIRLGAGGERPDGERCRIGLRAVEHRQDRLLDQKMRRPARRARPRYAGGCAARRPPSRRSSWTPWQTARVACAVMLWRPAARVQPQFAQRCNPPDLGGRGGNGYAPGPLASPHRRRVPMPKRIMFTGGSGKAGRHAVHTCSTTATRC